MQNRIKVLYVDDEVNTLTLFKASFCKEFDVLTAASGAEGLALLESNPVQIVVSDYRMPGMTGVEFLEEMLNSYKEPIRILISANTNADTIIDAVNKAQIYSYMSKPWDTQQIITTIYAGYEVFNLRAQNKELLNLIIRSNELLEQLLSLDL
jgi:response regulator RpfG family c-di-GMP phosphodiesterase